MIVRPPSLGALQRRVTWRSPALATRPVGAPGAVGAVGVTALDAAESGPLPLPFAAWTLKVYEVPGSSPGTVVEVGSGLSWMVIDGCATEPMNGVTM